MGNTNRKWPRWNQEAAGWTASLEALSAPQLEDCQAADPLAKTRGEEFKYKIIQAGSIVLDQNKHGGESMSVYIVEYNQLNK